MDKNQLFTSISLLFTLFLFSCQKPGPQIEAEEFTQAESRLSNTLKISKESTSLSKIDAMNVALMFSSSGSPETRGGVDKTVKSVIPVEENEKTLLYGVNFEDGYLLISGTKNYYPILAEVEHGYFNGNPTGTGADILLAEIKDNIKAVNAHPELRVNRSVWNQYEELIIPERKPATRSGFDDVVNDSIYNWAADGWTVYTLANQPENMPDDLYAEFCDAAYNENGEDPDYDYMFYTFITEKTFYHSSTNGPLLQTSWGQDYPYNACDSLRRPVGCVPIAAGQIMRYFEFPSYSGSFPYTLANMPDHLNQNDNPDMPLAHFLNWLRQALLVDDYGYTYDMYAESLLNYYGYNGSLSSHSSEAVNYSISDNRPVYMRGTDQNYGGHAWVCDGHNHNYSYVVYRLHLFMYDGGQPSFYVTELVEDTDWQYWDLYHMNWGWNGLYNGHYLDDNLITNHYDNSLGTYYDYDPTYPGSRFDIIISINE